MAFNRNDSNRMISTSENRVLKISGKFIRNKVKTLSFTVRGKYFPLDAGNQNAPVLSPGAYFAFDSKKPNSVVVSYGDGVFETYIFREESPGLWRFGWRGSSQGPQPYDPAVHTYTDNRSGNRIVSFEFQDLEAINYNPIIGCVLKTTPIEWIFTQIENIYMTAVLDITDLRIISPKTRKIDIGQSVFLEKLLLIPNQWFECKFVNYADFNGGFNFSDVISSNFFKINQWKELQILYLNNCNVKSLPLDSINELQELKQLGLYGNDLTEIPTVGNLPNLFLLELTRNPITNPNIPNWNDLKDLRAIYWNFEYPLSNVRLDFSTIPQHWSGLYSINLIDAFWRDNSHFDEFINYFYELVTDNGSIAANGSAMPYPNRFRNIAWGYGTLSFAGSKVAPAGYSQGITNGNPVNQGQKAYVLQNQYNHVITHA